jgi:Pentapeptide repeats (9 copies)
LVLSDTATSLPGGPASQLRCQPPVVGGSDRQFADRHDPQVNGNGDKSAGLQCYAPGADGRLGETERNFETGLNRARRRGLPAAKFRARAPSVGVFPLQRVDFKLKLTSMNAGAYIVGRVRGIIQSPFTGTDKLFAGQRLDAQFMDKANFQHCSFVNVSFKDATISESTFLDCAFVGCYFRRANLTGTSFIACKFIDCEFPKVALRACNLRYARFSGCVLSFDEVKLCLPQEPNLREQLTRNLAIEAGLLGLREEARAFRLSQIAAHEEDLRLAMKGATTWYREHYDLFRRIGAGIAYCASISNRLLWGYGERASVLLRNTFFLAFVVFPGVFVMMPNGLTRRSGGVIDYGEALAYSLKNFLPAGIESDVVAHSVAARSVSGFESFVAIIAIALLASYLFRWILDR